VASRDQDFVFFQKISQWHLLRSFRVASSLPSVFFPSPFDFFFQPSVCQFFLTPLISVRPNWWNNSPNWSFFESVPVQSPLRLTFPLTSLSFVPPSRLLLSAFPLPIRLRVHYDPSACHSSTSPLGELLSLHLVFPVLCSLLVPLFDSFAPSSRTTLRFVSFPLQLTVL